MRQSVRQSFADLPGANILAATQSRCPDGGEAEVRSHLVLGAPQPGFVEQVYAHDLTADSSGQAVLSVLRFRPVA